MSHLDLFTRYDYDEFVPSEFEPWMRFDDSPRLGEPASDFPMWDLDGNPTRLSALWSRNLYTIVEFGSFT